MTDIIGGLLRREPVVITGLVVSVVVLLAGHFNVILSEVELAGVIGPIVAAILGRGFVTPVADPQVD